MTPKQRKQFNTMRHALITIHKGYSTPDKLRELADGEWGLDFEEAIEMAYENIQLTAKIAVKGIKEITA